MTRKVASVSVVADRALVGQLLRLTFAFGAGAARVLETISGFLGGGFVVRHPVLSLVYFRETKTRVSEVEKEREETRKWRRGIMVQMGNILGSI